MQPPVDVEALIRTSEPGTMVFNGVDIGRGWEFAFLIREEDRIIRRLSQKGRIDFRISLWPMNGIILIPMLLRISRYDTEIYYESWLNAAEPDSMECLKLLADGDRILVIFYGDDGARKATSMINVSRGLYRQLYDGLQPANWTMAEFDRAREKLYAEYPDVRALWAALERHERQS